MATPVESQLDATHAREQCGNDQVALRRGVDVVPLRRPGEERSRPSVGDISIPSAPPRDGAIGPIEHLNSTSHRDR